MLAIINRQYIVTDNRESRKKKYQLNDADAH